MAVRSGSGTACSRTYYVVKYFPKQGTSHHNNRSYRLMILTSMAREAMNCKHGFDVDIWCSWNPAMMINKPYQTNRAKLVIKTRAHRCDGFSVSFSNFYLMRKKWAFQFFLDRFGAGVFELTLGIESCLWVSRAKLQLSFLCLKLHRNANVM